MAGLKLVSLDPARQGQGGESVVFPELESGDDSVAHPPAKCVPGFAEEGHNLRAAQVGCALSQSMDQSVGRGCNVGSHKGHASLGPDNLRLNRP